MNVLFIDTTTPDLIVVVLQDNKILNFSQSNVGVHHSEMICNAVANALAQSNLTFSQLDAYACAVGPGSFTGIRIGIATVKGYNFACPKPLIAVSCLQSLTTCVNAKGATSAIIDAGNGYYFADYANGTQPCLIGYDDARAQTSVVGNGTATFYLDGALSLVKSCYDNKDFVDDLHPTYIRRSQAEDNHGNRT